MFVGDLDLQFQSKVDFENVNFHTIFHIFAQFPCTVA